MSACVYASVRVTTSQDACADERVNFDERPCATQSPERAAAACDVDCDCAAASTRCSK